MVWESALLGKLRCSIFLMAFAFFEEAGAFKPANAKQHSWDQGLGSGCGITLV